MRISLGPLSLSFIMLSAAAIAQQAVVCVNCSTIDQQILDYARQAKQLASEVETEFNTLNSYKNLLQNTVSLPQSLFGNITGQVQQITGFVKQGTMTSGYSSDMLSSLSAGTYDLSRVANFPTLVANESAAVGKAFTQAGRAINVIPDVNDNSSSSLAAIHNQALDSDSRNSILQAITGTNATNGQVSAADGAARAASMQALLTAEAARHEKESYIVSLSDAQAKAGIKAACDKVSSIIVPACQE